MKRQLKRVYLEGEKISFLLFVFGESIFWSIISSKCLIKIILAVSWEWYVTRNLLLAESLIQDCDTSLISSSSLSLNVLSVSCTSWRIYKSDISSKIITALNITEIFRKAKTPFSSSLLSITSHIQNTRTAIHFFVNFPSEQFSFWKGFLRSKLTEEDSLISVENVTVCLVFQTFWHTLLKHH